LEASDRRSEDPNAKVNWTGGPVSGIIAPDNKTRIRLVAASAPPGLETVAPPTLASISNNHRSYAFQWFAFAGIAALIYGLALRLRWKKEQKA
jgi:cytochrome oxidase assembly protein ShyY1